MKIAIDPGHGGQDTGCAFEEFTEAALVFLVAEQLSGFDMRITRGADEDPSFKLRARRATGCDAAVVLHFNSGTASKTELYARGANFWTVDPRPSFRTIGGTHTSLYDTRNHTRPTDAWLAKANNCLVEYTIPAVLVEIAYLSDPAVREYLRARGTAEIAAQLSSWITEKVAAETARRVRQP